MIEINMADVYSLLEKCRVHLIVLAIVLAAAIVTIIAVRRMKEPLRKLIRAQAGIAVLLATVIVVNLILTGPMNTILSLTDADGQISEASIQEAEALGEEIAGEGIVLLKNEGGFLPVAAKPVNVFGWASTNPCYSGTGSGSLSPNFERVSLLEGLENAGFSPNKELSDFYVAYNEKRPLVGIGAQNWTLPEPPVATYDEKLIQDAKDYSDTALIVITRVGGEGADLPRDVSQVRYEDNSADYEDFEAGAHILQLSRTERDLVELVCGNFENVVLIYNGANAFELGFAEKYPQIRSIVWCPGLGQTGFNALGRILSGAVNPSGKTVDTVVADLTRSPAYWNFGHMAYDNMDEFGQQSWRKEFIVPNFVKYVEGIYVGYRFYETAAAEALIDYDSTVLYPFGYGLSYTTFSQEMGEVKEAGGVISLDVKVTNTGNVAGKEIVEVYYTPPYTNGGIEKAAVNLATFGKTRVLEPGASETLTLSFPVESMASYDEKGAGAWVLEKGEYGVSIRSDAHHVIAEGKYTVPETIVYDENHPRSTDHVAAQNRFGNVSRELTTLSRKDHFANYAEVTAAPTNFSMSEAAKATFYNNLNYNPLDFVNPDDEMPVTGVDNGIKLADLRGKDYDDPKWEALLDELSIEDMKNMTSLCGYQTQAIESVGKLATVDVDGPTSLFNNFSRVSSIGFPSSMVIASTWNLAQVDRFAESITRMAYEMDVTGWYAPAINIHRTAFSGRNYEYYSEDGLLSGRIAARVEAVAKAHGIYGYIKHFALNDQETNRENMLCTWSNEQAMREIYLKPFEMAVKEGGATAVMSSFNFIGNEPAAACAPLLKQVLREEWGFRGMVLTDAFSGNFYQDADRYLRNGNDAMLCAFDTDGNFPDDVTSATAVKAMRQACKNIMYTVVNSRIYDNNAAGGLLLWQKLLIGADIAALLLLLALEFLAVRRCLKRCRAA